MSTTEGRTAWPGGWLGRVVDRWRTSLRLRVSITTVLVGVAALVLLGAVVSVTIRDGLFEARRDEIIADAASRTRSAQERFDAAIANTGPQVELLASDLIAGSQGTGGGVVGAMLLRSPGETSQVLINELVMDERLLDKTVLTSELRKAVADGGQHWQSISLPLAMGGGPGIIVGSEVILPVVGTQELYIVYSLRAEEDTLRLVMQVLSAGAGVLLVFLGAMTWLFAQRVLAPVRQAARSAERLADGLLDERLEVLGNDEMATLGRSFNEMAESLQDQIERMAELSRLQQRFVSDVSHELRTPLTTIRMASEVLHASRDALDPAARRSAELLQTQLDRFEQMLADLLEISRFDAGAAVLDVEERDLQDVVAHAVELAAPLAERSGSTITVHGPGRPCTADIDPRRVDRIIRNLLVNAIEHGESRPIDITVGVNDTAVAVVVRDHGTGMTPEAAQHVFDRFWRADPARARTTGGTGLGLSISLEDARLHGGTLEAWGEPGEGAAFRLVLPRRAGLLVSEPPLPLRPERVPDEPAEVRGGPAAVPDLESLGGR
ncbi:HAMP domain-containing protein [Georgenia sp. 311]|uniref:Sensor histidine kinase MtrB n=1 Tax=Georgenia wutianyii TaxID=2585135 RepID=A0ABX5VLC0_9MICO|nr:MULTISPECIES: MtrAB system histidine kinase MtrB [Georgenia]QDB78506.1 HAMP domain-containing protein [Georgenia wutianyii]TNC20431.1 HAMP domain-containing protein [Georgenia sp. 311]